MGVSIRATKTVGPDKTAGDGVGEPAAPATKAKDASSAARNVISEKILSQGARLAAITSAGAAEAPGSGEPGGARGPRRCHTRSLAKPGRSGRNPSPLRPHGRVPGDHRFSHAAHGAASQSGPDRCRL